MADLLSMLSGMGTTEKLREPRPSPSGAYATKRMIEGDPYAGMHKVGAMMQDVGTYDKYIQQRQLEKESDREMFADRLAMMMQYQREQDVGRRGHELAMQTGRLSGAEKVAEIGRRDGPELAVYKWKAKQTQIKEEEIKAIEEKDIEKQKVLEVEREALGKDWDNLFTVYGDYLFKDKNAAETFASLPFGEAIQGISNLMQTGIKSVKEKFTSPEFVKEDEGLLSKLLAQETRMLPH